MTRIATTFTLCAALLLSNFAARCGASGTEGGRTPLNEKLASGMWGGQHVRMDVTEGGVALEFDCASGEIERPLALDAEGRFDVGGKFYAQHGGPVRRDEEAHARAARYRGRVRGETLTLTVTLSEPEEDAGTFTLTRGQEVPLTKCR
ncbi:MAG: hypothetical protein JOZ96_21440 [Acidobacteria bacterium]|nr:hypothetical protein [Acidobacteriota bacterium]